MPLSSAGPAAAAYRPDPTIFREYDIRGIAGVTLREEDAQRVGRAFAARVAREVANPRICVGWDGRVSSPALRDALCAGLTAAGAQVLRVGLGPTPMLYYAVATAPADGGVMVTGSHNPPDQNGFKFMLGRHAFYGDEIRALMHAPPAAAAAPGQDAALPVEREYVRALLAAHDGKRPLKVAWDAGNGAAGRVVEALTRALPGVHLPLFCEIDGAFPYHHPDPSVAANLRALQEAVRREGCDVGLAFDGDGDRLGVVDNAGELLASDHLLMLFARDVLEGTPGAAIIADVKVSDAFFDEVTRLGGKPLMWKTGHALIKAKMAEVGAAFAGEQTGHLFFADRYYGFDDALYAAIRLLSLLSRGGRTLSDLRRALPALVNTPELRFPCSEERKFNVIDEVRVRLEREGAEFNAIDGVRVRRAEGWWLLRASNTQPMLVARCEAKDAAGLKRLRAELAGQLALSQVEAPR